MSYYSVEERQLGMESFSFDKKDYSDLHFIYFSFVKKGNSDLNFISALSRQLWILFFIILKCLFVVNCMLTTLITFQISTICSHEYRSYNLTYNKLSFILKHNCCLFPIYRNCENVSLTQLGECSFNDLLLYMTYLLHLTNSSLYYFRYTFLFIFFEEIFCLNKYSALD